MRLGIDIGGTTIHLGLIDEGKVVKIQTHPSFVFGCSLEDTYDYLCALIGGIITDDVEAIGIGVPSVVDAEKGIVYDTANIPSWKEVHLKEVIESKFNVPVSINNDSNCFALGAYESVKDLQPKVLLGITLGTGVGMGVVSDGKILNGSNTGVGEISCTEYLDGVYEDYTGSKFFSSRGVTGKQVYDAAMAGDAEALKLFKEYAFHLGKLLTMSLYAYDPDVIVIGGGMANSFDLFKDDMMECVKNSFAYKKPLETLKVIAMPSEELPVIGASTL